MRAVHRCKMPMQGIRHGTRMTSAFAMCAWYLSSTVTLFLLTNHVRPVQTLCEGAYLLGLSSMAISMLMVGAAACLHALGS